MEMIRYIDHTKQNVAEKILEIQIPAYQVEANLINYFDIPPLLDTVESLRQCNEMFYGYFVENKLAGVISITKNTHCIDICRLVVHPDYFRRGIGKALLSYVLMNFQDATQFSVTTGEQNEPAKRLYISFGFIETKIIEIAPNIFLSQFEKNILNDRN